MTEVTNKETKIEQIICDICGKTFKKQGGLTTHRKWHDLPENKTYQEETRKKLGHKKENHPLYGKPRSNETKEKIRLAKKGNSKPNAGSFVKGRVPWNAGLKGYVLHSEESRERISKALKGVNRNEKHGLWKGENASYSAIHLWVERYKPKPKNCETCQSEKKLELSNIDHKYRRNINDFRWLCHPCHMKYDAAIRKTKKQKRFGGKLN